MSGDGVRPDPEKVTSLRDFPTPHDLTSLRSFLGLANQLGHFIPDLSHLTIRLRALLKSNVAWFWMAEHEADFKRIILLLKPFNPVSYTHLTLPTIYSV